MQKASGPKHSTAFLDNYRTAIIAAALMLFSFIGHAQKLQPINAYGYEYKRGQYDTSLGGPTGCGVPGANPWLVNVTPIKNFLTYYDTCGHKFWVYDPQAASWAGFTGSSIDTTSISHRIDLAMKYSDTAMQTANYAKTALTVANFLGAPALYEDVAANRPLPGAVPTGTLFIAVDTKLLYRNNGSGWDNIGSAGGGGGTAGNPTAAIGFTAINGVSTSFMRNDAAPPLDTVAASGYYVRRKDSSWLYITPSAAASLLSGKVSNNGAATGIKVGPFLSRPSAVNCQCIYIAPDSGTMWYDNSAWVQIAGIADSIFIRHLGLINGVYSLGNILIDKGFKASTEIAPSTDVDSVNTFALVANSVANSKLATMAANTIKGSVAGGTPADLSKAQVTAMLNTVTTALQGVAPAAPHNGMKLGMVGGVATWQDTTANSGLTNPMTTAGDMIVGGSTGTPARLAVPAHAGMKLGFNGTTEVWQDTTAAGGGGSLPTQTGQATKFLQTDGTNAAWKDLHQVDTLWLFGSGQSQIRGGAEDGLTTADTASDPRLQIFDNVTSYPGVWKTAHVNQNPFWTSANGGGAAAGSPNAMFYLGRYMAQKTGKIVRIAWSSLGGTPISAWWTAAGAKDSLTDSIVVTMTHAGYPTCTMFFWDHGESDPLTVAGTYNAAWEHIKYYLRTQSFFPKTTPIVIMGMPQVAYGAAPGYQGQDPNLQTRDYNGDPWDGYANTDSCYTNPFPQNNVHFNSDAYKLQGTVKIIQAWLALPGSNFTLNNGGVAPGANLQTGDIDITSNHPAGGGAKQWGLGIRDTAASATAGIRVYSKDSTADFNIAVPNPGITFLDLNTPAIGTRNNFDWDFMRNTTKMASFKSTGFNLNTQFIYTSGSPMKLNNTVSTGSNGVAWQGDGSQFMTWTLFNSAASSFAGLAGMFFNSNYMMFNSTSGTLFMNASSPPNGGVARATLEDYGSFALRVDSGTTTATMGTLNQTYLMKPTASDTVFLPNSSTAFGRRYDIFNTATNSNTVTLVPFTSQALNRSTTPIIIPAGFKATVVMDGTNNSYVTLGSAAGGGGFTNPMTTTNDMIFQTGGTYARLAAPAHDGMKLSSVGGSLAWQDTTAGGGGTQNLEQVLTTGGTLTGNHTITNTSHTLTFTGGTHDFTGATILAVNQTALTNNTTVANTHYVDAAVAAGGSFTDPTTTTNDMIYKTGGVLSRLAAPAHNGMHLTSVGGSLGWADTAVAGGGTPGGSTTQFQYNNAGAFGGSGGFVWDNTNSGVKLNSNSLGTTLAFAKGLYLQNSTAAAAGAQQISPILTLEGQGWKTTSTAASQPVGFTFHVLPVQGTTVPTSILNFNSQINGTQFTAMQLTSTGGITGFGGGAGGNFAMTSGSGLGMILYPASGSMNLGQNVSRSSEMISFNNGAGAQHFCNWWNSGGTQTMEFNDGGALGIGVTPAATPLYVLGIKAGTSVLSQINLAAGTKTTSMVAGDLTYATGHLWFHDASDIDLLSNFYNSDGTLTSNRTVTQAGNVMSFTGGLSSFGGGSYNNSIGSSFVVATSTVNNPVTAASGTVTDFANTSFAAPTVTSTNTSVTYTNASTVYISDKPTASTNSTFTNAWALKVAAGKTMLGGDVTLGSHLVGLTGSGTLSANTTGLGTGGTPSITVSGSDNGGHMIIVTGTSGIASSFGTLTTVSFDKTFAVAPRAVILTPANSTSAGLTSSTMPYVDAASITTTGFTILANSSALANGQSYQFYYMVIQ